MVKKRTPIEAKINREAVLLLAVGELCVNEIIAHYEVEDTSQFRTRLSQWKIRANQKHLKLSEDEQTVALMRGRELYYGKKSSAIAIEDNGQHSENIEESKSLALFSVEDDDELLQNSSLDCNELQNSSSELQNSSSELQNSSLDCNILQSFDTNFENGTELLQNSSTESGEIADILAPNEENDSSEELNDKSLQGLKDSGVSTLYAHIKRLQNSSISALSKDEEHVDKLAAQLVSLIPTAGKPSELKALTQAFECIVALRRKMALLPYGVVSPSTQPAKEKTDKHLHLHNYGLKGFTPGHKA